MKINEIISEQKRYSVADYADVPYDNDLDPKMVGMFKKVHAENPHLGPHEGKTLNLMLNGMKPAALIGNPDNLPGFKKAIEQGKLVLIGKLPDAGDQCIVATPEHRNKGELLMKLFPALWKARKSGNENLALKIDAKIGLTLGYPKDSIRHYLSQQVK